MSHDHDGHPYATLANYLHALGSPTRLELLSLLRTPRALSEIRVRPSQTRDQRSASRALSRQGITRHLDQLVELGVVSPLEDPAFPRGEGYVLNQERLFAIVDELRSLARWTPSVEVLEPGSTIAGDQLVERALPPGPRLLVAYGVEDGLAFPLAPDRNTWTIGRARECDVRLAYDPFLSARNTQIDRAGSGFTITDLGSRNGTRLNFTQLREDDDATPSPLRAGDLLTVGHTHLVFQV